MLMSDPVILTTSNNVVDKSTICRHLLRYVLDLEKSEINVCSGTNNTFIES